jgi:3-oxosteroid 1-dehydrogenase
MATPSSSYDVVILGSGIAGLPGALAAHELGLKPVVLEKAAALGGGTVHSYGLIWVGQNYLARDAGIADSHNEVLAYLRFLSGGAVDEARLAAFVARSAEVLKFFADCGIRFRLVHGVTDHYYEKAPGSHAVGRTVEAELISGVELGDWRDRVLVPHDVPCFVTAEEQIPWGGINSASHWDAALVAERRRQDMSGKGLGLICRFVAAMRERGVPMLTTQPVARLALDSGRVTGVVMGSGELIAARRAVLLATGGYGADPQMSWEFERLPGFAHEGSGLIPQSLTGDGVVLGAEIGGIVHKVENSLRVMLSYTIPAETPGGTATSVHAGIVELCSPHTLLVNRHGKRFADETFFQGIVPQLRLFDPARHEYPNLSAYLIFDAQYLERFSFANRPIGSVVTRTVACADTLSEVAGMLRIDADGLQQTVSRFNGFAASGVDEDFHRGDHQWKLARPKQPGNGSLRYRRKTTFLWHRATPSRRFLCWAVDRCARAGDPSAASSDSGALCFGKCRCRNRAGHRLPGWVVAGCGNDVQLSRRPAYAWVRLIIRE